MPYLILILTSCIASLILVAVMRLVAPKFGLTDKPDGHRKLHGKPIPLGGGLAIFLATVFVLAAAYAVSDGVRGRLDGPQLQNLLVLLGGACVIVVVGLCDDKVGLSGRRKLLGQLVAASIIAFGCEYFKRVVILGAEIELDKYWLSKPCTIFWLVGAMNSLNLLDGIDGLASMLGLILVATVGLLAVLFPQPVVAMVAFTFAGALVGFLRYNFPPASIFLGDTGSMLIGLVVGTLAIEGSFKGAGTVLLAAPLAIWAIPIFDSVMAIVRRRLTGRSIYTTDRGHLHHRLMDILGSNRKALAMIGACCIATSAAGLLSVLYNNELIALLTCAAVMAILIVSGIFGRAEFLLLGSRLGQVGRSLMPLRRQAADVLETAVHLQGSRPWDLLWQTFKESSDRLGLMEIHLDVNLPALREGFHASWERPNREDRDSCWRMEYPLRARGQLVGRVVLVGKRNGHSSLDEMQHALELIDPFEARVLALSEAGAARSVSAAVAATSPAERPAAAR